MPARRQSRPLDAREILQFLIVGFGWVGFVWLWILVGRQPWESSRLVWLILGSLAVLPLITLAWVVHNRAIFKRKGERRGTPAVDHAYDVDWHGRQVDAHWATLQASRHVTIGVKDGVKTYRSADLELARLAAARRAGEVAPAPPRDGAQPEQLSGQRRQAGSP